MAAHSLVESFAVLTRLPGRRRLAPRAVLELLEDNLRERIEVAGFGPRQVWPLLRGLAPLGVAGGRTYDALIARAVKEAGACELLTLNPAHFAGLEGDALRIVEPG